MLHFTENIDVEFEDDEVVLRGDEDLLGDNKVRAALEGEASLFKDIPLLTPEHKPLKTLLKETKEGFLLTPLRYGNGPVFDFLIEINSPINTIQKLVRIRTNDSTRKVKRKYPDDYEVAKGSEITLDEYLSKLGEAYTNAKDRAEEILSKEKSSLDDFITSEVSRLRKKESEEVRERIKAEVKEPIKLQKEKVESLKEDLKEGRATGKNLESAKKELQKRKSDRKERERNIREEVGEKYKERIEKVRRKKEKCKYNIKLISSLVPAH